MSSNQSPTHTHTHLTQPYIEGEREMRVLVLPCLAALMFVVVVNGNRALIFNFGDSNSDTGGYSAGTGVEIGYPYGRAFFHPPTGRASDGRLIIDFLCEYVDTHYLRPYLDSLEPDFRNGVNLAVCGACALPKSVTFNLNTQLLQFKRFYKHSLHLHSNGQKDKFGKEEFQQALYTIDIGQNDLSGSFASFSYAQVIHNIPSFISEIKDAMWEMYKLGGRNFWVHNTGPLGCLPRELALRRQVLNDEDFDEYGCVKSMNDGAQVFNTKLKALCEELQSLMDNSTIVYVDLYSIKYDLVANASSYGFERALMGCCGYGGAPYNYDDEDERTCLTGGYTVCEEGRRYISWDGVHYTEAANAIVASKILSTHYSSPPLPFNYFFTNNNIDIATIRST